MQQAGPGFERDRPLFRAEDVDAISFAFNLASYEDVRTNADGIHRRLADEVMPCDARWPSEQAERFRAGIDTGSPP
jgi:hypothetical protein